MSSEQFDVKSRREIPASRKHSEQGGRVAMAKHKHSPDEGEGRLRPVLYRELGKTGWRVPQSEQEVRAAEQWLDRNSVRLPDTVRLREAGQILDRYLREDERHGFADGPTARGDGEPDREVER
jgi:hypothetical protein